MTASDVTKALTCSVQSPFYYRRYLVVPNVYWGLGFNHELDICALSDSGFVHEIEIKISRSDLKRDIEKRHGHFDERIRCLWFAGPEELSSELIELAPERSGIIVTYPPSGTRKYGRAKVLRKATPNTKSIKFTESERLQLARLGTMRYWSRYEEPTEAMA